MTQSESCLAYSRKGNITMKKLFILEDLDCAHCAAKIEEAVGKIAGVKESKVTFLTQKLNIEIEDGADEKAIKAEICKIVKKLEPDVEVVEK